MRSPQRVASISMLAVLGLLLVGSAAPVQANPIELLQNGGFEAGTGQPGFSSQYARIPGDATSWTETTLLNAGQIDADNNTAVFIPFVGTIPVFPAVSPTEGSNMGVLSPNGLLDSSLSQSGLDPQGLPYVTVSFDYRIQSLDLPFGGNAAADTFTVSLGSYSQSFSLNDPTSSGISDSGWQHFTTGEIPVSSLGSGPFTLQFSLNNDSSLGESTRVFIDNASVLATPEPTSLAIFAGMMGVGGVSYLRRRKKVAA